MIELQGKQRASNCQSSVSSSSEIESSTFCASKEEDCNAERILLEILSIQGPCFFLTVLPEKPMVQLVQGLSSPSVLSFGGEDPLGGRVLGFLGENPGSSKNPKIVIAPENNVAMRLFTPKEVPILSDERIRILYRRNDKSSMLSLTKAIKQSDLTLVPRLMYIPYEWLHYFRSPISPFEAYDKIYKAIENCEEAIDLHPCHATHLLRWLKAACLSKTADPEDSKTSILSVNWAEVISPSARITKWAKMKMNTMKLSCERMEKAKQRSPSTYGKGSENAVRGSEDGVKQVVAKQVIGSEGRDQQGKVKDKTNVAKKGRETQEKSQEQENIIGCVDAQEVAQQDRLGMDGHTGEDARTGNSGRNISMLRSKTTKSPEQSKSSDAFDTQRSSYSLSSIKLENGDGVTKKEASDAGSFGNERKIVRSEKQIVRASRLAEESQGEKRRRREEISESSSATLSLSALPECQGKGDARDGNKLKRRRCPDNPDEDLHGSDNTNDAQALEKSFDVQKDEDSIQEELNLARLKEECKVTEFHMLYKKIFPHSSLLTEKCWTLRERVIRGKVYYTAFLKCDGGRGGTFHPKGFSGKIRDCRWWYKSKSKVKLVVFYRFLLEMVTRGFLKDFCHLRNGKPLFTSCLSKTPRDSSKVRARTAKAEKDEGIDTVDINQGGTTEEVTRSSENEEASNPLHSIPMKEETPLDDDIFCI